MPQNTFAWDIFVLSTRKLYVFSDIDFDIYLIYIYETVKVNLA